jgi:hypothetical protein
VIDLSGKRYGRLKIVSFSHSERMPSGGIRYFWNCECDCGNKKIIGLNGLFGKTVSCGCYHLEILNKQKKYNKYTFHDTYVEGYTEKDEVFYFDLEDYDKIKDCYWHIEEGYVRNENRVNKKRVRIAMHRLLLDAPDGIIVDHINQNRADNRKCNLRFATKSQNSINSNKLIGNSKFRGVVTHGDKWVASIKHNKENLYIGIFNTFEEAVEARIKKEIELFGEFSPYYKKEEK